MGFLVLLFISSNMSLKNALSVLTTYYDLFTLCVTVHKWKYLTLRVSMGWVFVTPVLAWSFFLLSKVIVTYQIF